PSPTDDGTVLFEAARAQLERADLARPVRLTGVSASGFDAGPAEQLGLFAPRPDAPRRAALNAAVDAVNQRFGRGALRKATLADEDDEG
ncbi:MAG TPA: DNA polymerase IV, partial [Anaeromyxobacteraceae bacterium]